MFYVLVDVYLRLGNTVEVFKDVPHGLLHRFHGEKELLSVSSIFIACIFDRYGGKDDNVTKHLRERTKIVIKIVI